MRIAFLTPEFVRPGHPDGGLANYLGKLAALLRARGHDPVIFLRGERERAYEVDGVSVVETPASRPLLWRPGRLAEFAPLAAQARDARRLARAFRAAHARKPFDLVQAASYQGLAGALAGRSPVPLVIRVSSYTPLLRAAHGAGTTLGDHLMDWRELRPLQLADALFAPSRLLADLLGRLYGLPVEVIRSPFSLPAVTEDPSLYERRLAGKTYLFYFGALSRLKGVDTLADALPGVLQARPDLHAVFAGRDDNLPDGRPCSRYILDRAASYTDRVHLLGSLERPRLLPVLRHARLVVLPSRIDNYPNTCLEAQHLGRVVIATRGSSLEEMIEDGVTGYLTEIGSPHALMQTILRALDASAHEQQNMAQAIAQLAQTRSPDRDVEALLDLYRRVLQR